MNHSLNACLTPSPRTPSSSSHPETLHRPFPGPLAQLHNPSPGLGQAECRLMPHSTALPLLFKRGGGAAPSVLKPGGARPRGEPGEPCWGKSCQFGCISAAPTICVRWQIQREHVRRLFTGFLHGILIEGMENDNVSSSTGFLSFLVLQLTGIPHVLTTLLPDTHSYLRLCPLLTLWRSTAPEV